jgi:hypothetical protein
MTLHYLIERLDIDYHRLLRSGYAFLNSIERFVCGGVYLTLNLRLTDWL